MSHGAAFTSSHRPSLSTPANRRTRRALSSHGANPQSNRQDRPDATGTRCRSSLSASFEMTKPGASRSRSRRRASPATFKSP